MKSTFTAGFIVYMTFVLGFIVAAGCTKKWGGDKDHVETGKESGKELTTTDEDARTWERTHTPTISEKSQNLGPLTR